MPSRVRKKMGLKTKENLKMSSLAREIRGCLSTLTGSGWKDIPFLIPTRVNGKTNIREDVLCLVHGPLAFIVDFSGGQRGKFLVLKTKNNAEFTSYDSMHEEIVKYSNNEDSMIISLYDPTKQKRKGPWIDLASEMLSALKTAIGISEENKRSKEWRDFEDAKGVAGAYVEGRIKTEDT